MKCVTTTATGGRRALEVATPLEPVSSLAARMRRNPAPRLYHAKLLLRPYAQCLCTALDFARLVRFSTPNLQHRLPWIRCLSYLSLYLSPWP